MSEITALNNNMDELSKHYAQCRCFTYIRNNKCFEKTFVEIIRQKFNQDMIL